MDECIAWYVQASALPGMYMPLLKCDIVLWLLIKTFINTFQLSIPLKYEHSNGNLATSCQH